MRPISTWRSRHASRGVRRGVARSDAASALSVRFSQAGQRWAERAQRVADEQSRRLLVALTKCVSFERASLLGAKIFPVLLGREFGCKPLKWLAD